MQDRFKFRGKRIDNNHWYYGSYLYLHNPPKYDWNGTKHESKEDFHFIIDEKDVNYGVYPETVGQCTGIKDKNGKLIYNGDILKFKILEDFGAFGTKEKYIEIIAPVIYEYGGFFIEQAENSIFLGQLPMSEIEVIGNIYENPELLSEVE